MSTDNQWSPDREFWWDGRQWQRTSPDRTHWWDGTNWRPIPDRPDRAQEDQKRSAIRRYFVKTPNRAWPIILIVIGIVLSLIDGVRALGILTLLVGIGWLAALMVPLWKGAPDDQTMDSWLREDVVDLKTRALQRLNLEESQLESEPLVVVGPVLWETLGVPLTEVRWKKGKDGRARFSISRVTILHLIEHKVSSFQCDYNFIRGVALNERDDEYYYKDIVAVSTRDESTNYQLPNRAVMRHAQAFALSVASGERISVIVSAAELRSLTGGASLPDSGADTAIRALRKTLSDKKMA